MKTALITFQLVIVLAALILQPQEAQATAIVDSTTAKQCRNVCLPQGTAVASGKTSKAKTTKSNKSSVSAASNNCLDSCVCGVFCSLLEQDAEWSYDTCYVKCTAAKPNAASTYEEFFAKFLA